MRFLVVAVVVVTGCKKPAPVVDAGVVVKAPSKCSTFATCSSECDQGRGESCASAAVRAFAGMGTSRDLAAGWALEAKGCELGHLPSCARLGLATSADAGMSSATALRRATEGLPAKCAENDSDACDYAHRLGLDGGFGHRAAELFAGACDAGVAESCNRLGVALFDAEWSAADPLAGAAALQRACDLGLAGACATLGIHALQGRGMEIDEPKGRSLLKRAGQLSADAGAL
ncbi:MAG: sel1 repeat family protein [Archangiaceae bacterium]|nr:sel1 repeat family protein [Archangiaceae bacterium]